MSVAGKVQDLLSFFREAYVLIMYKLAPFVPISDFFIVKVGNRTFCPSCDSFMYKFKNGTFCPFCGKMSFRFLHKIWVFCRIRET